MSLLTVLNGQLTDAGQLNDIINALQQPSGGSETGNWFMAGSSALTNGTVSVWLIFTNHLSTPSGISINTSILAPTGGLGSVATAHLETTGVQIYAPASAASNNAGAGGGYTTSF
jgi:hypothetical protein